jgi:hypothetical protein
VAHQVYQEDHAAFEHAQAQDVVFPFVIVADLLAEFFHPSLQHRFVYQNFTEVRLVCFDHAFAPVSIVVGGVI